MTKIKISCNSKDKNINYAYFNSKSLEWIDINQKNYADSKLISKELSQDFSTAKVNKILDAIIEEFNDDRIELLFAGTEDEYAILSSICKEKKYRSIVSFSRAPKEVEKTQNIKTNKGKANIRNKRLHISMVEVFFAFIFAVVLVWGAYFFSQYLEVKSNYNIKETAVDFIISAPSKEQVNEIAALSHIKSIVPYFYRTIEVSNGKKSIESNLYIIESENDLPSTVFSEELLIRKLSQKPVNPLYISDSFSKATRKSLNDVIDIVIDGKTIKFLVAGIYKGDNRNVGGTIIAVANNEIVSALSRTDRYNGAYISSNDIGKTRSYLEEYQPLGDLRTRDEFSSDEAYNIYLSERKTDKGRLLLDREKYLNNVEKRNDAERTRLLLLTIVCVIVAVLTVYISVCLRLIGYIKKHADNDMRNSFTLKQERSMFRRFCFMNMLMLFVAYILVLLVSWIAFDMRVFTYISLIGFVVLALLFICEYYMAVTKLDAVFTKRVNNQK